MKQEPIRVRSDDLRREANVIKEIGRTAIRSRGIVNVMQVKSDALRRQLPEAMDHIVRGGMVEIHRYNKVRAVMLPPPPEGMRYVLAPETQDEESA